MAQVPTFVGSNGFILTESIAIAIYCESCPTHYQFALSRMSHIITFSYPCLNLLC